MPRKSSVEPRATGRKQPNIARGAKRERLEIMAEILSFCSQQRAKTNIMYGTNLNYEQLKNHLKSLTSQRLLIQEKGKYATTERGHRFLESYARLQEILNDGDL
jgi:predicted transcriptional regulator